jgi:hypothetical protein
MQPPNQNRKRKQSKFNTYYTLILQKKSPYLYHSFSLLSPPMCYLKKGGNAYYTPPIPNPSEARDIRKHIIKEKRMKPLENRPTSVQCGHFDQKYIEHLKGTDNILMKVNTYFIKKTNS